MPPRRKSFYQDERPEDRQARQRVHEELFEAPLEQLSRRPTKPVDLPIERIRPNPFQARQRFEALDELAEAIRVQGFTSRLRVRPDPAQEGFFQLVYGERRLRAAKRAGLTQLPCEVAEHSDEDMIEIGLAENIQRRDLNPIEEARAFQSLINNHGYSLRTLAERIGKDKNYIDNRVALLRTPEDVQQLVEDRPDTIIAAREIAKLPDPEQRQQLLEALRDHQLNVQEVRSRVRTLISSPSPELLMDDLHYTLKRDLKALKAVFRRWRELYLHAGAGRDALLHGYEELLSEVELLGESLQLEPERE